MRIKVHLLGCALLAASTFTSSAFSLQGPAGMAVNIDEEYRWNVPIITYSFDQSFVDYFGEDGVRAVQEAIDILNAVPRASRVDIDSYPLNTTRVNLDAELLNFYDLKSMALSTILQQLGLASPTAHIFDDNLVFRGPIQYHNFDPVTLQPSFYVNGILYTAIFGSYEIPVDPFNYRWTAVADQGLYPGEYYTGLTRDDVGGLRYLLSRTNINREPVPSLMSTKNRIARRGGVEKILFVPMRLPRNSFGGMVQPDFVFSAGNNEWQLVNAQGTHWIPYATINGNPGSNGPGVIRGPVQVTFQKLGDQVVTSETYTNIYEHGWGSFDEDNFTALGASKPNRIRTASVRLFSWGSTSWTGPWFVRVPVPYGGTVALQISTNNVDWTTLITVVNKGGTITWDHHTEASNYLYMRAVPADASNSTGGAVGWSFGGSFDTLIWREGFIIPVGGELPDESPFPVN